MVGRGHAELKKIVNVHVHTPDGPQMDMSYVPLSPRVQTPEQVGGGGVLGGTGGLIRAPLRTLMVAWPANVTLDGNWGTRWRLP